MCQLIKFGRLVGPLTASTSILRLDKPMEPYEGSGTGRGYPRPFDEVGRLKIVLSMMEKYKWIYGTKFAHELA